MLHRRNNRPACSTSGVTEKFTRTGDPIWRQTLFLYVNDPAAQSLEICIEHVTSEDEEENVVLGSTRIKDLAVLCDGEVHDCELNLHRLVSLMHRDSSYMMHPQWHPDGD